MKDRLSIFAYRVLLAVGEIAVLLLIAGLYYGSDGPWSWGAISAVLALGLYLLWADSRQSKD